MSRNSAGRVNQSHFANIQGPQQPRSTFDRSRPYKTTFDAGKLIPFFLDEILPGDVMKAHANFLIRLATPIFPYMDNVYADVHWLYVPRRIVWENFERQQGAQDNPGDSTDYLTPQLDATTHAAGFGELSIYDYFGLPTKVASIPQGNMPNSLPLRAYVKAWNDWYRDENLQNTLDFPMGDGPDTFAYSVLPRGRRKDYFMSCLPWPQKGPSVSLPLGSIAPVIGNANAMLLQNTRTGPNLAGTFRNAWDNAGTMGATSIATGSGLNITNDPDLTTVFASLDDATAATVNQWREAIALQHLFEADARGGTRYVSQLLARWGVVSPDFRLQRTEFLGGGTIDINVNPIAQTSETGGSPQGTLAGYAVGRGTIGFNHSFVEHGYVIGLLSVRADMTYQQGLHRLWSRRTRYDDYNPEMANIGEQAVLNKEIYMQGTAIDGADNDAWGYNERWAEYRYSPGQVTGLFRSNATAPLDSWHLALDFSTLPVLAGTIEENPPIDRIIAVPAEPQFIMDGFIKVDHTRPLPTYSTPGLSKL